MIEELSYYTREDEYGEAYAIVPPSTREITDKINEIIKYLNEQNNEKIEKERTITQTY